MTVIYFLLPFALLLGLGFLGGFLWVVWQGQYDELETPAHRMLLDDDVVVPGGRAANPANLTQPTR